MKFKYQLFIIIFSLCLMSTEAYSQFFLGGRVGVNMSTLSSNVYMREYQENANFTPKISVGVGALAYLEIGPYVSLQPEIMYTRYGSKNFVDYEEEGVANSRFTGDWNVSLHYIETPMMFKLSLNTDGFDPFIEFGPYVSWMFAANLEAKVFDHNNDVKLSEDYGLDYRKDIDGTILNKKDFGFKVGIGGAIKLSKGIGFFSFRYSRGLRDVFQYSSDNLKKESTYNGSFVLTIGVALELRKSNSDKVYYY